MRPGLAALFAMVGCGQPSDVLYTRDSYPPVEVSPGVFRVTWSRGADAVRGFTPDGARIIYYGRDLPGLGDGAYVLSVGVAAGDVREELEIYRRALLDTVTHFVPSTGARLLVTWRSQGEDAFSCRECPPAPPVVEFHVRRLPAAGIVTIGAFPARVIPLPNHATTFSPAGCPTHRIRIRPVDAEVRDRQVNPLGPVERPDGSAGFYSDGEALWRYDPLDPTATPDSIGPGAYPALAPDGLTLAAAVPLGLDSTVSGLCQSFLCCLQETVTFSVTGWAIVLHDLNAGTSVTLGDGSEPAFDPLAARIVVRRPDALYWMDQATGAATAIPGTRGGYAPAVSPDGALLAFTADTYGNGDVFYTSIR